jgi:hypothetical protein
MCAISSLPDRLQAAGHIQTAGQDDLDFEIWLQCLFASQNGKTQKREKFRGANVLILVPKMGTRPPVPCPLYHVATIVRKPYSHIT